MGSRTKPFRLPRLFQRLTLEHLQPLESVESPLSISKSASSNVQLALSDNLQSPHRHHTYEEHPFREEKTPKSFCWDFVEENDENIEMIGSRSDGAIFFGDDLHENDENEQDDVCLLPKSKMSNHLQEDYDEEYENEDAERALLSELEESSAFGRQIIGYDMETVDWDSFDGLHEEAKDIEIPIWILQPDKLRVSDPFVLDDDNLMATSSVNDSTDATSPLAETNDDEPSHSSPRNANGTPVWSTRLHERLLAQKATARRRIVAKQLQQQRNDYNHVFTEALETVEEIPSHEEDDDEGDDGCLEHGKDDLLADLGDILADDDRDESAMTASTEASLETEEVDPSLATLDLEDEDTEAVP